MDELSQHDVRGGSSLVDGVRWCVMMRKCTKEERENLHIDAEESKHLVQMSLVKANNVPIQPSLWLRRLAGGVLQLTQYQWTAEEREESPYERVMPELIEWLKDEARDGRYISLRELERRHGGKAGIFNASERALRGIVQNGIKRGALVYVDGDKLAPGDN